MTAATPTETPARHTAESYYGLLVRSATDGTFPSVTEDGTCRYRGPNGAKCAVGVLMDDETAGRCEDAHASTLFPNLTPETRERLTPTGLTPRDIARVQRAHDLAAWATVGEYYPQPWSPRRFVAALNALPCFAAVPKTDPETLPTTPAEDAR